MGIAISRRLAEIMDGSILIGSALNRGIRFTIMFKNVRPASLITMSRGQKGAPDEMNISFEKASILIVDTNEINRNIMIDFLREFDFERTWTYDLPSALKMVTTRPVDVII